MTDNAAPGIAITRTFEAPRELVYAAWIDPKQFAAWFGGAETEVPAESVSFDVREGGSWKLTMLIGPEGPNRSEMPWYGEFVELTPPSRIVMTLADSTAGDERETVTVTFAEIADDKTEMVFEQRGGHMDAAGYEQVRQGWLVFFDVMATVL